MVATVINSQRAVQMSVYIVRAGFLKLREALASNVVLARKLAQLERSVVRFEEVYAAIRVLTQLPAPRKRSIGFTADLTEREP